MSAVELRLEFEDLLYYEVWLLDHDRLEEWLALCAEQVRYWAPVRANVPRGAEDWTRPHMLAHFDEDKGSLALRVQRIRTRGSRGRAARARAAFGDECAGLGR